MKELTISISIRDLQILKDSGYNLCLAVRPADTSFDVIWQATSSYGPVNYIKIDETFQLFCSNQFIPGKEVRNTTDKVAISRGQRCTLNKYLLLEASSDAGRSGYLSLKNDYGSIYVGYCMGGVNFEGVEVMNPAYLTSNLCVPGICELNPLLEVMIWFEQNAIEGETMEPRVGLNMTASRSRAVTVDMANYDKASVIYQDGSWRRE